MSRDALVVGINKYPFLKDSKTGKYKHLTTPADDAEAIAQLLETHGNFRVKRFPSSIIDGRLQVDPNPNKPFKTEDLEQAILDLFLPETGKPPETALLFFAGHGLRKQLRQNLTQGYLAASDVNPSKIWGFSLRDLWDYLQKSEVKQQIIWLDCCFAGELLNFKDTELGRQSSECDRSFIAASRDYEVAYQQLDGKHGVLTGAILAGLNPEQVPEGDWITNLTLAVSVEQKLQAYYEQTKIPQTPLISNHGEVIKLLQGKTRPDEVVGNTSKKELQTLLHWLIRLLEDDAIASIQVNSIAIPGKNSWITANDIVVLYEDGHSSSAQIPEIENLEYQNQLDLERIVPNGKLAILVLEKYVQNSNTYLRDTKYKITSSDLLAELAKHGLNPTPKRSEAEILANFNNASRIGRNWLRQIDGKTIPRSEISQIIQLIEEGSRTILLVDRPGIGKTCILLELADRIESEKASVWGLLFIKGDRFTNISNEQELTFQGLPEDIVGQCARLADYRQVVVIIDSLDVLSLSRQHASLKVFLGIIDRLEKLKNVTVIVACRNFDLEYDPLLRGRSWQHKVNLQPLDFDNQVKPFLIDWQVDVSKITPELRVLLQIPQNLRIYEKLAKLGVSLQPVSAYELYNSFLEEIVVKNSTLGTEAIVALQNMAEHLIRSRSQSCSKASLETNEEIVRLLISQEVLWENSTGTLEFSHQTLRECITIRASLAKNQTLAQFILQYPQLPFIRPSVRAFFFYLRASQPDIFRRQVWEVLSHNKIAYHVKRLVVESFAEIVPVDEDWRSLRRIFQNYPDLFQRLLQRANNGDWWNMITQHWLPEAKLAQDRETWLLRFVQWLGAWMNVYPAEVVAFWREAIVQQWANPVNIAGIIRYQLRNFEAWGTLGIRELLETLVEDFDTQEDFLGELLSRWVQSTNSGDILLWRYITKNILPEDIRGWNFARKLRCMPHDFHDGHFLEKRLRQSDTLITLVVDELERWSGASAARYGEDKLHGEFLRDTSWEFRHSQRDTHSCDDINILFNGVEKALKYRVRQNDPWWLENESRLRNSQELSIRYLVIETYKENICYSHSIKFWLIILDINCLAGALFLSQFFQAYICGVESLLQDKELFRHSDLSYELGELIQMAYPKISESAQIANQAMILSLCSETREYEEEYSFRVYSDLYNLCLSIPSILRNSEIQNFVEDCQNYFGSTSPEPNIYSWGGCIMPPLSPQDFLKLSNQGIFQVLRYYEAHQSRDRFDRDMIGGFSEVKRVLCDACCLNPTRFIDLFIRFIQENLHQDYVCALVEGVASHLRYRFGNLMPPQGWKAVEPLLDGEAIASILLSWLERYFIIWEDSRTVRYALEACCDILTDNESAERLSLLLFWLYTKYPNDRKIRENSNDVTTAINSVHGVAVESAVKLCNRLLEKEQAVPEMLLLLLKHAAQDAAIYVRIPILQHLPFLTYKKPDLGWQLLADVFKEPQPSLWKYTEKCFYYNYQNNFGEVAPYLKRLLQEGMEEAGETWGRISTLASLAGHISQEELLGTLQIAKSNAAWKGATQVFTANLEQQVHTVKCISGLISILCHEGLSNDILRKIDRCFEEESKRKLITREFAIAFLEALSASVSNIDFDGFLEWLGYESRRNPLFALELTETLVAKFETTINVSFFWRTEPLITALNEILREADETDDAKIIQRAINLQDSFLKFDMPGIEELLNNAGKN